MLLGFVEKVLGTSSVFFHFHFSNFKTLDGSGENVQLEKIAWKLKYTLALTIKETHLMVG